MKYIYVTILLLVSFFLAGFIQFNDTPIQLRYFDWVTPRMPVSAYIIVCFFAGWFLSMLAGFASGLRFRFRASGAEREVRSLRSELDKLKKEELEADSSEQKIDSQKPSQPDKVILKAGDEATDERSRHDHDPDARTVVVGSGGEEEK